MRRLVLLPCLVLVMAIVAATPGEGAAPPVPTPPPPPMPRTLTELRALEAKIQKTLEKIIPATVGVGGGGSGVVVSKDGVIICAAHVTKKAGTEVQITFPDGKRAKAKTLGNFRSADASLLKLVDKGPWAYTDMAKGSDVKVGQWALAVGYPVSFNKGQKPPVRIGRVLRQSSTSVATDCPIMGGDSGGPLFDLEGRVIGCNSSAGGAMNGTGSLVGNNHVAIDVYHTNWKRLMDGEDWGTDRNAQPKKSNENTAIPMPEPSTTLVQQKGFGRQSSQFERNHEVIREAFREAVEPVAKSTVRVLVDDKETMLGTIVSADGLIVTKFTALSGQKITCRLFDGKVLEAKKLGEDKECDLALLEVKASDLTPVKWASEVPIQGNLVAAAGVDGKAVAIGMVTSEQRLFRVAARPAGKAGLERGFMGVGTADVANKGGVRIDRVTRGTPAEKAGLKVGDVITQVGTATIKLGDHLDQALLMYLPDQKVDLIVKRGDKTETIAITLGRPSVAEAFDRWGGGPFSEKRFGYPKVLVHDTVLKPADCGGPLVDTSGRVVGLNISRSLRISTYALMAEDVGRIVAKLAEARKGDKTKTPEKTTTTEKETKEKEKK